jgi:hypothetical protein
MTEINHHTHTHAHHTVNLTTPEIMLVLVALKTCSPSGGGSPAHALLSRLCEECNISYENVPFSHVPLDEIATLMYEDGIEQLSISTLKQWSRALQMVQEF